jgi:hypothetical protein
VGEPVQYGDLASALTSGVETGYLLAHMLDRLSGRQSLLAPDITKVSIGVMIDRKQAVCGALLGSFVVLRGRPEDDFALEVARRLGRLRRSKGLPNFALYQELQGPLKNAAESVRTFLETPDEALNTALNQTVDRAGVAARGCSLEAHRIQDIVFPAQLFRAACLNLAIGAAYFQPPGEPWGRFAVFLIDLQPPAASQ